MPRKTLPMHKIRNVAKAQASGLSVRAIARACGMPRSTVSDYLSRIADSGLGCPLPEHLSEDDLEKILFGERALRGPELDRPLPEWSTVHKELRRRGVTLKLLWQEYLADHPDGYRYSQYCELYRIWAGQIASCMRQTHHAGEKLFVDYAGMTMPVTDSGTGEVLQAQIFVGALGASQYLYAEASATQKLADWTDSHVRCFEDLGGVPRIVVPDNLKSAVTRPCRYEPLLNRTYEHLAEHYGITIIPARPRKPKDKAKVESGVQIVEREVLAPLRDQRFFSLAELNDAIRPLLAKVNARRFQKLACSRNDLFEQLDRPTLRPLPASRYEFSRFKLPRVNVDYHVELDGHYYSVPYALVGQQVEARITTRMVEILHRGKRVACHVLDPRKGRHTTEPDHMPKSHRRHQQWTPSRLIAWGRTTGPHCAEVIDRIVRARPHPEQGYRSCLGLMRLGRAYGQERVEAACLRALRLDVCSYQSIKSILETGKDRELLPTCDPPPMPCAQAHANVRGRGYYLLNTTPTKGPSPDA